MTTAPIALALCIVFPILSLLAVVARFYARKLQKAGYQAESVQNGVTVLFVLHKLICYSDWVILPALVC